MTREILERLSMCLVLWMVLLFPLPSACSAQATSITILPTVDTYVDSDDPNMNHGSTSELCLESGSSRSMLAFVRFDLGAIPPSAWIWKANLTFFASRLSGPTDVTITMIDFMWLEKNLTYANTPWKNIPASYDVTVQIARKERYEFDVTSEVSSNRPKEAALNMLVRTTAHSARLSSRESSEPPKLEVTFWYASTSVSSFNVVEYGKLLTITAMVDDYEIYSGELSLSFSLNQESWQKIVTTPNRNLAYNWQPKPATYYLRSEWKTTWLCKRSEDGARVPYEFQIVSPTQTLTVMKLVNRITLSIDTTNMKFTTTGVGASNVTLAYSPDRANWMSFAKGKPVNGIYSAIWGNAQPNTYYFVADWSGDEIYESAQVIHGWKLAATQYWYYRTPQGEVKESIFPPPRWVEFHPDDVLTDTKFKSFQAVQIE